MSKKIKSIKVINAGSLCDIDIDNNTEGREKVLQYVVNKYGKENVAGIITPTPFKAKNSLKTVATLYNVPPYLQNQISDTLPESAENVALADLLEPTSNNYPLGEEFRKSINDDKIKKVVKDALYLDGRLRGTGVHACGFILSSRPIIKTVPTQYVDKIGMPVTQWNYYTDESLGLIKMDFLGLDTIDIIQNTIETIKNTKGIDINISKLLEGNLNDKQTLDLFKNGYTTGIFQFEGDGVKELLKEVKPDNFLDLPAITALYRPGPMSMNSHTEYAKRKQNPKLRIPVDESFKNTKVEEILNETYSLLVYQEQIMNISKHCAGFTAREADNLRKGIGKKNPELIKSMADKFIKGMIDNGYNEKAVKTLWDGIVGFGAYSFNKSHSVAYALTSYIAAYLKAHFPVEYMACLLKQRLPKPDKFKACLTETKRMGIVVQPASVNESDLNISANSTGKFIVYGLTAIKQLNRQIAKEIITERQLNGKYKSLDDFMTRLVNKNVLTNSAIKSLADVGAFDCFNVSRKSVAENSDKFIKAVKEQEKNKNLGSLFDFGLSDVSDKLVNLDNTEYSFSELVKREADLTDMFLSHHPLDKIEQKVILLDSEKELNVTGLYVTFPQIKIKSKKGKKFGFALVDNKYSRKELVLDKNVLLALDKGKLLKTTNNIFEIATKLGINTNDSNELKNFQELAPLSELVPNLVYKINVETVIFNRNDTKIYGRPKITSVTPVDLAEDGRLAVSIKVNDKSKEKKYIKKLKNNKGKDVVRLVYKDNSYTDVLDVLFLPGTTQDELFKI